MQSVIAERYTSGSRYVGSSSRPPTMPVPTRAKVTPKAMRRALIEVRNGCGVAFVVVMGPSAATFLQPPYPRFLVEDGRAARVRRAVLAAVVARRRKTCAWRAPRRDPPRRPVAHRLLGRRAGKGAPH